MATDVDRAIASGTRRGRARAVLGAAGAVHALHDGCAAALYVLFPLWASELSLSLTQVGLLKSVFSGFTATFQLPAGLLAERLGERGLLALGTAGLGLGFVLFGQAGGFAALLAALALAGVCTATQHPLASGIVSGAFRDGGRRAALGTYNFAGDVGKALFPAAVAALAAVAGWRAGSLVLGVLGIVAGAALFLALVRLEAGTGTRPAPATRDPDREVRRAGWGIRDRRGFAALSAIGVADTGGRGAFLTFMPFVLVAKGAGVETVGLAVTLVAAGGAAGKLACGLLSERFGILRTVIATEAASAIGTAALVLVPLPVALAALPFLGVALNGTSSVLYGTVGDLVERDRQTRAFGLFYTLGFAANAIAPLLSGASSDLLGLDATMMLIGALFLLPIPLCLPLAPSLRAAAARRG